MFEPGTQSSRSITMQSETFSNLNIMSVVAVFELIVVNYYTIRITI